MMWRDRNAGIPTTADVRAFWEGHPVAAASIHVEPGAPEFYAAFDRLRNDIEPEALQDQVYGYADYRQQTVLEVGCGNGYLLSRYARHGARAWGIDLTRTAVGLARRRFDLETLRGPLPKGTPSVFRSRACPSIWSYRRACCTTYPTSQRPSRKSIGFSSRAGGSLSCSTIEIRYTTGCSTRCTGYFTLLSGGRDRRRSHARLTASATRLGEHTPGRRSAASSPRSGGPPPGRSLPVPGFGPCRPAEPCWACWRNGSVGSSYARALK